MAQGRRGKAWRGAALTGKGWQAWLGAAGPGMEWQAWRVEAWLGFASQGRLGVVRFGLDW